MDFGGDAARYSLHQLQNVGVVGRDSLAKLRYLAASVDKAARFAGATHDGRHPVVGSHRNLTFGGRAGAIGGNDLRALHRDFWTEQDRKAGRQPAETRDTVPPPELRAVSVSPGVTLAGVHVRPRAA